MPAPSLIHAAIAYIESALEKSRVVVIGNALDGAAEIAIARGARLCQVLDPDPKRVASAAQRNAERRITFSQLSELSFRDGAYDVAIIENLGELPDPSDTLDSVRRALSSDGIALIGAAAEGATNFLGGGVEPLGYADFLRKVQSAFPSALTLAQTPFVASAIVRLDLEGPPTPALDNAFLGGEADEVSQYLALSGSIETLRNLKLEEMSVVQVPARAAIAKSQSEMEARVSRAERRAAALEQELEAERSRPKAEVAPAASTGALEQLREQLDASERELERAKRERKWADDRVRRLERELEEALEAQEELAKAQERILTLQGHLKDSEDEVDQLTDKLYELEPEVERLKAELAHSPARSQAAEDEVAQLERQLEERGRRILELEEQARQLDIIGRASQFEGAGAGLSEGKGAAEQKLLELSQVLAAREAELQSLRWTLEAARPSSG